MNNKDKVLKILEKNPKGLIIKDIANILKISRNTVAIAIAELKGAKKIEIREIGNAKLIYSK